MVLVINAYTFHYSEILLLVFGIIGESLNGLKSVKGVWISLNEVIKISHQVVKQHLLTIIKFDGFYGIVVVKVCLNMSFVNVTNTTCGFSARTPGWTSYMHYKSPEFKWIKRHWDFKHDEEKWSRRDKGPAFELR